jgi:hypothetical protein
MRLTFKHFDGRGPCNIAVIDEDTGNRVGEISCDGVGFAGSGGILISLFGERYSATVHSLHECRGFIRGVETALNAISREIASTQVKRPWVLDLREAS